VLEQFAPRGSGRVQPLDQVGYAPPLHMATTPTAVWGAMLPIIPSAHTSDRLGVSSFQGISQLQSRPGSIRSLLTRRADPRHHFAPLSQQASSCADHVQVCLLLLRYEPGYPECRGCQLCGPGGTPMLDLADRMLQTESLRCDVRCTWADGDQPEDPLQTLRRPVRNLPVPPFELLRPRELADLRVLTHPRRCTSTSA
jgi:hypothetical protein